MSQSIHNQLAQLRQSRGISASDLARRIGVTRQTIYAIESGAYIPNTAVSLRMAAELGVSVEQIFQLPATTPAPDPAVHAELLSHTPVPQGTPVRLCDVGDTTIAVPATAGPSFLNDADAVLTRSPRTRPSQAVPFSTRPQNRIALAGCDPALGLLAAHAARDEGVDLLTAPASSGQALDWLRKGKVHIAGTHLRDPESGEFNLPFLRRKLSGEDLVIITFAHWEEGLVTATGNPRGIHTLADLTTRRTRFINREPGSGSRALFDRLLAEQALPATRIAGSDRLARGHLDAAYAIARGDADCCIATRSAAQAFGLSFVPLQQERFDLVLRRSSLTLPGMQALLDILQRAAFRRKLQAQAGYETRQTGAQLA